MKRAAGALALIAAAGCTGIRVSDAPVPAGLEWPPGNPRVRLERVVGWASRGGAIATIVGENRPQALFSGPHGVAWLGRDLVVSDPGAGRIVRIAENGRISRSGEGLLISPLGLATCDGEVVTTEPGTGRVVALDASLQRVLWVEAELGRPTGVACAGGSVYVVDTATHRITVLKRGEPRRQLGGRGEAPGRFNFPTAAVLSGGDLWVGDTLNFRVQRLDPASGAPRGGFGSLGDAPGDTPRLKGVAVDAEGNVWISDAHLDRVSVYQKDGTLLTSLGRKGTDPGEFAFPAGIAARPDGKVAVVDALNRRVQVFSLVRSSGVSP